VAEICIDEYLWSLYERTPKIDTNKVTEQIKSTIKKKGKTQGGIAREQVPAPRGRQETAQPRSPELSSSRFAPLT
jgi:hypothetical protein